MNDGAKHQAGKGDEHQNPDRPTAVHNPDWEESHLTTLVT